MRIKICDKNQSEPAFPEASEKCIGRTEVDRVAILQGGMQSGKTSLAFLASTKLGDVMVEMSAAQFEAIAGALRGAEARWNAAEESARN